MPNANPGALWSDQASSVASATRLHIVQTSPGVFEILAAGPDDAALVSDGAGGYVITPGGSGTGRIALLGTGTAVII